MRIAALYDIHGNLPALEAVLEDVRRADVDQLVIGGDVVPGPMPRESIECLRHLDLPVEFIRGNGDREIVACMRGIETGTVPAAFREVMHWVAGMLDAEHEELLDDWPETLVMNAEGLGDVLFCHATPWNDMDIFTRLTPEDRLLPVFDGVDEQLVVCGHTHMQFDRFVGPTRVVNAGSVGMPFGEPGAFWLLLGPDVELRRTPYDLEDAARRTRETEYPQADDFADSSILDPPSEEDVLEAFAETELT